MATHDQYIDLLAENERLRDRLRAAETKLQVYAYWMARVHKGERDAVSLAERCLHDIANADELYYDDDTTPPSLPRATPPPRLPALPPYPPYDGFPEGWHPPLVLPAGDLYDQDADGE